jgi:hypothetical protein
LTAAAPRPALRGSLVSIYSSAFMLAQLRSLIPVTTTEEYDYLEWLYIEATRLGDHLDLAAELFSYRRSILEHEINCQETYDSGECPF